MKRIIQAVVVDLNNVGEDYESFSRQKPHMIRLMTGALKQKFAPDASGAQIARLVTEYSKTTHKNPLFHYPCLWQLVAEELVSRPLTISEIEEVYDWYLDGYLAIAKPYADFAPFLDSCRGAGYRTGLVSNGNPRRVYRFLEHHRLLEKLDSVIVSGSTPVTKPAHVLFSLALRRLRVHPFRTLFVGDRPDTDIAGASQVGMWTARLKRGVCRNLIPTNRNEIADVEIANLSELATHETLATEASLNTAVVVCGGKGIRMGESGQAKQKCMMEVGGKPILEHVITRLSNLGVERFHLLVGHRAEDVRNYFGDGTEFHASVSYHATEASDTGSAIKSICPILPEFCMYSHGDIVLPDAMLSRLVRGFYLGLWKQSFAVTARAIAPTHPCFYMRGDRAAAVVRHPNPNSDSDDFRYSIGFGILSRDLIQKSETVAGNGEITTEQLFSRAVSELHLEDCPERWFHLEKPEDISAYTTFEADGGLYE